MGKENEVCFYYDCLFLITLRPQCLFLASALSKLLTTSAAHNRLLPKPCMLKPVRGAGVHRASRVISQGAPGTGLEGSADDAPKSASAACTPGEVPSRTCSK